MKKTFILTLILSCLSLITNAQDVNIRLTVEPTNTKAQTIPRVDKDGVKCAIVLVDIVGVKDMKFKESFGNVDYSFNEYTVYLTKGTKTLTYSSSSIKGSIDFDDYLDGEIAAGTVYRLVLESGQNRSAVFYIKPTNAKLIVNDQKVSLNKKGAASIDLPNGTYKYSVSAEGRISQFGTLEWENNPIITKDIELEEVKLPLTINTNEPSATIFVDDIPLGSIEGNDGKINLPIGKHNIRIIKEGFKEFNEVVTISNQGEILNAELKRIKTKIIKHKYERTKSTISLRSHGDIIFSGLYFLEKDAKSGAGRFNVDYHQYLGLFALKEGFGFGFVALSDEFAKNKYDDHFDDVTGESNKIAFLFEMPLQIGLAVPLSKYNTSHMGIFVGGYGSYNYIGHASENMKNSEAVSSGKFDYGLRANVNFYLHKFIIGFEGNHSLSKMKLGTSVAMSIGLRIYNQ